MYETFLPRTPEDDAREALAARFNQGAPIETGMRVGDKVVPVCGPPRCRFDVTDRMADKVKLGIEAEKGAVRLQVLRRQELLARERLKKAPPSEPVAPTPIILPPEKP